MSEKSIPGRQNNGSRRQSASRPTAASDLLGSSKSPRSTAKVGANATEGLESPATRGNGAVSTKSLTREVQPSPAGVVDIFFHPLRGKYLVPDNRGVWIPHNKDDAAEYLVGRRGFRIEKPRDGGLDSVGEELLRIRTAQNVDYADALAGYHRGYHAELNGKRVLVTSGPKVITPVPGEWSMIRSLIDGLLADESHSQATYLHAWMKDAYVCLQSGQWRPGQILGLLGPRGVGKGLLQAIITQVTGGREASPYAYLSGRTDFNGELFMAEHLKIEDEAASTDLRARRQFGNGLKQIAANRIHKLHDKYCRGIDLPVFWRCTLSLNSEPENVLILPPMDESMEDKFILFKCSPFALPMPTETVEQEEALWKGLTAELPHYLYWLLHEFALSEDLKSNRYAVRHFHHPDVMAALRELAPEEKMLQLIDSCRRLVGLQAKWAGKAVELEALLTAEGSGCEFEARRLFLTQASCGQYLARLARRYPDRVKEFKRVHNTVLWEVRLAQGTGSEEEANH